MKTFKLERRNMLDIIKEQQEQEKKQACDHNESMAGSGGIYCPTCDSNL